MKRTLKNLTLTMMALLAGTATVGTTFAQSYGQSYGGYGRYEAERQCDRPRYAPAPQAYYAPQQYVEPRYDDRDAYDRDRYFYDRERARHTGRSIAIVGGTAGAGAAIGAIAGGGRGAAIGALSGGALGLVFDAVQRRHDHDQDRYSYGRR